MSFKSIFVMTCVRRSFRLPPIKAEISVRSLRFYDEQRSKFMPWLLPDLLNGAFGPGFNEEDKNRLLQGAAEHAKAHAHQLIEQLRDEVEASAPANRSRMCFASPAPPAKVAAKSKPRKRCVTKFFASSCARPSNSTRKRCAFSRHPR